METPESLISIHLYQHQKQIVSRFLDTMFDMVETCFEQRDLDTLNRYLEAFMPHVTEFTPSWTIGVLRASSRAKTQLSAWIPLRDKVAEHCTAVGFDTKRWMRGMLDK